MSKKRMQISATLLGILLSAGTFASAYPVFAAQSEVSVENNVDIGNINISLEKHGLDEKGEKTDFDDAQVVVPGQVVDELVDIFNLANDAWVRMKVTFDDSTIDGNMLDDSLLNLGDDWVKCGDYYYYTKPVKTWRSCRISEIRQHSCGMDRSSFRKKIRKSILLRMQFRKRILLRISNLMIRGLAPLSNRV